MLIGIDASRANRKERTGTENYAFYLIKHFAQLDKDNQFILYSDQTLSADLSDLVEAKVVGGQIGAWQKVKSPYDNFQAKILKWPFPFFWTIIRLSWEMLCHKPDILFVPSHTLPLILARRNFNTVHDVAFMERSSFYAQSFSKRYLFQLALDILVRVFTFGKYRASQADYLRWSTLFSLKHSDKIITVSDSSRHEINNYFPGFGDKINVIHNGYDTVSYRASDEQDLDESVLDTYKLRAPYALCVGRVESKKNITKLLESWRFALDSFPGFNLNLVLAGRPGEGFQEIHDLADSLSLGNKVTFLGWVPECDMPAIMRKALFLVFPSHYEGFGLPLLHAMACGTPILASDIAVFREVAGSAALFFDRLNVADLAEKTNSLHVDSGLRASLSEAGLKRSKDFDWAKCAQQTLELIKS